MRKVAKFAGKAILAVAVFDHIHTRGTTQRLRGEAKHVSIAQQISQLHGNRSLCWCSKEVGWSHHHQSHSDWGRGECRCQTINPSLMGKRWKTSPPSKPSTEPYRTFRIQTVGKRTNTWNMASKKLNKLAVQSAGLAVRWWLDLAGSRDSLLPTSAASAASSLNPFLDPIRDRSSKAMRSVLGKTI